MQYSSVRERTEHVIGHALAANRAFLEAESRAKFERLFQPSATSACDAEVRLTMKDDKAQELYALENAIRLMLTKQDDLKEKKEQKDLARDALDAKIEKLNQLQRQRKEIYAQTDAEIKAMEEEQENSEQEASYLALAKELGRLGTELEEKRALKNKLLHDADAKVLLEGDASCTEEEEEQAGGGGRALPAKFQ